MKRYQATILFILILTIAKLSEPSKEKEPRPEQELIWIEGDRIIADKEFLELTREERQKLIQEL